MKLVKNFLSLTAAEFLSKAATFAAFAYLARVLGPDGFGNIEFAGAVVLCAGLIVDQGFGFYGAREIARAPGRTAALVSEIVVARFALAVLAYAAIAAFAVAIDRPAPVTRLLLLYGLSVMVMPLLLQWVFQGHDRMGVVALFQVLRQAVFALVVFAFVRTPGQMWVVALADVAGVVVASLYGLLVYCRRFGNPFSSGLTISSDLIYQGVPIGLSQMFWVVKMFGATVILGLIATAEDVGFFAAAMRILIALHTFVWLYHFNLLPSLARGWQKGGDVFSSLVHNSMRTVAWVGAVVWSIWVLVAPAVMTTAYGPSFSIAGPALQVLSGVFILAWINGHYRYGLIAAGRQDVEMATEALGAIAALALIPVGYARAGVTGAAAALVVVEGIVWWATWWGSRRWLGLIGHARVLFLPLAAAVFVTGLLWRLPFASPVFRVAVVLVFMPLLAFALDGKVREVSRRLAHLPNRPSARHLGDEVVETTQ